MRAVSAGVDRSAGCPVIPYAANEAWRGRAARAVVLAWTAAAPPAFAQQAVTSQAAGALPALDVVAVWPRPQAGPFFNSDDASVGAASESTVSGAEVNARPFLRPAEALEVVPGLVVTQHSGEGKANQYFLRGMNLDHGTDFATRVEGMPVNMPTHGHGQGYMDVNFVIPELVERIIYRKGTYYADLGNFSAVGAAELQYVDAVRPFPCHAGCLPVHRDFGDLAHVADLAKQF